MAIVVYGGGVAEFWGSIGGTTFSKASGLYIAKSKPIARRRLSPLRVKYQSRFSTYVDRWKNVITDDNRIDWNLAALEFSQSKHGQAYTISGFNLHIAINFLRKLVPLGFADAPGVFTGRRAIPDITWSWNAGQTKLKATFDAIAAFHHLFFWWTDGCRASATVRKAPYVNFVRAGAAETSKLFTADYDPTPGMIFFHYILLDQSGSMSTGAYTRQPYPQ